MTDQPDPPSADAGAEHAGVASALLGLDDLDALPVAEHVARFHALHESLTAALAGIDGA